MSSWSDALWRCAFWFVGGVLIATGTGKILDLEGFVGVVEDYNLVSRAGARLVAWSLPFIELAAGLCLVAGRIRNGGVNPRTRLRKPEDTPEPPANPGRFTARISA